MDHRNYEAEGLVISFRGRNLQLLRLRASSSDNKLSAWHESLLYLSYPTALKLTCSWLGSILITTSRAKWRLVRHHWHNGKADNGPDNNIVNRSRSHKIWCIVECIAGWWVKSEDYSDGVKDPAGAAEGKGCEGILWRSQVDAIMVGLFQCCQWGGRWGTDRVLRNTSVGVGAP